MTPKARGYAGWRCLDVRAGSGSVATLLAHRVGPSGTVVAADIDLRFPQTCPRTWKSAATTSRLRIWSRKATIGDNRDRQAAESLESAAIPGLDRQRPLGRLRADRLGAIESPRRRRRVTAPNRGVGHVRDQSPSPQPRRRGDPHPLFHPGPCPLQGWTAARYTPPTLARSEQGHMAVKVRFAGGGRVDPPSSWGTPRRMGSPIRLERELTLGIRPR